VFKEFFTSLCKAVFDADRGLWLANVKNELYPNPHAYAIECEFVLSLSLAHVVKI
jgi:ubiquitin-protein ligase E3 C